MRNFLRLYSLYLRTALLTTLAAMIVIFIYQTSRSYATEQQLRSFWAIFTILFSITGILFTFLIPLSLSDRIRKKLLKVFNP
ncbi:MAG: hypothetical protein DMF61_23720 [Blastocatellia bacterium AA13]|nr:MAG: hypothetical protein DMF61_23720 [Blastocatellia bacterium AA13]